MLVSILLCIQFKTNTQQYTINEWRGFCKSISPVCLWVLCFALDSLVFWVIYLQINDSHSVSLHHAWVLLFHFISLFLPRIADISEYITLMQWVPPHSQINYTLSDAVSFPVSFMYVASWGEWSICLEETEHK